MHRSSSSCFLIALGGGANGAVLNEIFRDRLGCTFLDLRHQRDDCEVGALVPA